MFLDPVIPALCVIAMVVLALAIVLRRLRQPHVVAYILAGVIVGPGGLGLVDDLESMSRLGSIGIVLLLFFVGLEVNLSALLRGWKIAVGGTLLQILFSLGAVWLLGLWLDWSTSRIVLLGFVISLSSTAVVMKLLEDRGEIDTRVGRNVIGVSIIQDLALVPMVLVLSFLGGETPSTGMIIRQALGAAGLLVLVGWVMRTRRLPALSSIAGDDGEMRLLTALLACFGLAFATGLLGLSTALGAFIAGVLVTYSQQGAWIRDQLMPFRDLMVGAFFVSVGMMIAPSFVASEWRTITGLVLAALVTNTAINAAVIRLLGDSWPGAWYAGALLAPIGELSFLLAALGRQSGVIGDFGYQATVVTIAITMTVSPLWIAAFRRLGGATESSPPDGV